MYVQICSLHLYICSCPVGFLYINVHSFYSKVGGIMEKIVSEICIGHYQNSNWNNHGRIFQGWLLVMLSFLELQTISMDLLSTMDNGKGKRW